MVAADLVQIELAAEDGVPPGDVVLALEVPVEGLSRDAGVAADLGHGNLVERFVHRMKNFHLDAQIGGIEDVLAQVRSVIIGAPPPARFGYASGGWSCPP